MRPRHLVMLIAILALIVTGCRRSSSPPTTDAAGARSEPEGEARPDEPAAPEPQVGLVAPSGAGFEVRFPGEPEHASQRTMTAAGLEADVHEWVLGLRTSGDMVMLVVSPLVDPALASADPEAGLRRLAARHAATGREPVERPLTLGEVPGVELVHEARSAGGSPQTVTTRYFLAPRTLYQLVGVASDADARAAVASFMESFRLTAASAAPGAPAPGGERWAEHLVGDPGEGGFGVSLPGEPERSHRVRDTAWGQLEATAITAAAASPPAVFEVTAVPLPELARAEAPHALLDAWEARVRAAPSGAREVRVDRRVTVRVAGLPGRSLVLHVVRDDAESTTVEARYVGLVAPARFYELAFLPLDEEATVVEAARFVESFRLLAE